MTKTLVKPKNHLEENRYSKKTALYIAAKLQYRDFMLRSNCEEFKNSYTRYTIELSILRNLLKYATKKTDIWKINYQINSIKITLKEEMNILID